jgi:hypothetical protein
MEAFKQASTVLKGLVDGSVSYNFLCANQYVSNISPVDRARDYHHRRR